MAVKLHQPVAGLNVGDTYSGPMEQFLLAQGYASDGSTVDTADVLTDAEPDNDPRLADNREAPGETGEVKGEAVTDEPKNAPELNPEDAPALPAPRNTVLGLDEDEAVTKENADAQATVDPADVEKAPAPAAPKARTRVVGDKSK